MDALGDVFYEMYRVDLQTLDLIIGEAQRIRAERQGNALLEAPTASGSDGRSVGSR